MRPYPHVRQELVDRVREQIGAVAAFRHVAVVMRLPKTRSGKVLRATMRAIADSQSCNVPATIDDPRSLEEIAEALRTLGYASASRAAGQS
jgi:propionyl-CoA synthetase